MCPQATPVDQSALDPFSAQPLEVGTRFAEANATQGDLADCKIAAKPGFVGVGPALTEIAVSLKSFPCHGAHFGYRYQRPPGCRRNMDGNHRALPHLSAASALPSAGYMLEVRAESRVLRVN